MATFNENLQQWQKKIDALSLRERALLLATAVVVVVMSMQVLLLDPVLIKRKAASGQVADINRQIVQQRSEQQIIAAQLLVGIDRAKIKRRDQLQLQLDKLNEKIQQSIVAMIPPRIMPQVLEQLLQKSKGIKLLSLENKPVIAIVDQLADSDAQEQVDQSIKVDAIKKQTLYNHSFVLRLNGNYSSVVDFFERLSELPWRFYWDELKYEVDTYPNATITLKVHTVSMSEEWIGV